MSRSPSRPALALAALSLGLGLIVAGMLSVSTATAETRTGRHTVVRPVHPPRKVWTPTPHPSTACRVPTVAYRGVGYCPATFEMITTTAVGTGVRVAVHGTVMDVGAGAVTVGAWTSPPCGSDLCGASMELHTLSVAWPSTVAAPPNGWVVDLFGTTTTGSMSPVGFTAYAWCPIDLC